MNRMIPDVTRLSALNGAGGAPLPAAGAVSLTLNDLAGRRVRVLLERTLPAGPHEVAFDRQGLAGGLYFMALESGGQRARRKLVILP